MCMGGGKVVSKTTQNLFGFHALHVEKFMEELLILV